MNDLHRSVNVNVPVRLAYEQWMRLRSSRCLLAESSPRHGSMRSRSGSKRLLAQCPASTMRGSSPGNRTNKLPGRVFATPHGRNGTSRADGANGNKDTLASEFGDGLSGGMPGRASGLDAYPIQEDLERLEELVEGSLQGDAAS